ncbi:hypothetical protein SCHIN_v1c07270 [Spiroplasma chinense]|uniref:Uncharacterized protein n=1 Tax=Spiroplasma chinense TaxID=216932 RepID=A0A5B9Y748_9MOLU|nr:hypothetical protein [Spiroplasma chinense]QEH61922.1 hypothetical protein SCHIN_v1c07270 [Spiroplasma chinense]
MKTLLALLGGLTATGAPAGVLINTAIARLADGEGVVVASQPDMYGEATGYDKNWLTEYQKNGSGVKNPNLTSDNGYFKHERALQAYHDPMLGYDLVKDIPTQDNEPLKKVLEVKGSWNLTAPGINKLYQVSSEVDRANGNAEVNWKRTGGLYQVVKDEDLNINYNRVPNTEDFWEESTDLDGKGISAVTTHPFSYVDNSGRNYSRYLMTGNPDKNAVNFFDVLNPDVSPLQIHIPEKATVGKKDLLFNKTYGKLLSVFQDGNANEDKTVYITVNYSNEGVDARGAIVQYKLDLSNYLNTRNGDLTIIDAEGKATTELTLTESNISASWPDSDVNMNANLNFYYFVNSNGDITFSASSDQDKPQIMYTAGNN